MIEHWSNLQMSHTLGVFLAQLSQPGIDTPEEAALVFSGPQFFIALLSGLILTFGFQLLLTNLSVAAGISYVGHSSSDSSDSKSSSGGVGPRKIGIAFGLWTLITVSLALFFACLLAVKLSLYNSALLGAITGLVIWGTYFCLLFWVSSTTVGSLIGSVVKTATSSFQSLVGTATAAMGAKAASNQTIQTAEAAAAAIRRELSAGWNSEEIGESLKDYLSALRSPGVETDGLEAEFERMLRESDVMTTADRDTLSQIDRQAFVNLLNKRTDLSRQEVNRVADRLYRRWQNALSASPAGEPMMAMVDYLRSAKPDQLVSEQLGQRLDEFLEEYRKQNKSQSQDSSTLAHTASVGFSSLMSLVMGRTDLSDFDVSKIRQQLQQAKSHIDSQATQIASQLGSDEPGGTVKADVENYLLNTYAWQLAPARLKTEFRNLLYDPQADGRILKQQLQSFGRPYFADLLRSRGMLTPTEIEQTSRYLETVRQQVIDEVTVRYRAEAAKALQLKVDTFLEFTPREELLSDMGTEAFRSLLEDEEADAADLQERFTQFGYEYFYQRLRGRGIFNEPEAQQVASKLDQTMQKVQADAQGLQTSVKVRAEQQWQGLQDYLRNTGKGELNPEGIKADVRKLMNEPDAGAQRLRKRLARFDRDTLVQLLSQRQEFSKAEVEQVVDQVESNWYQAVQAPAALSAQAQAKYDQATHAISSYLRKTGKPELNPTGIQRDLKLLLNDPKAGFDAMQSRLASMDRDTLVQLLSQRDDLSEAEVNQIIDDTLSSIQSVLRLPQRLARRAQTQAVSFKDALEDYLRSTDKAELSPAGIKRDLQVLLNDPKLGSERLQDRLAHVNRDTVVALLAQRDDMTQADAEATVDQVLAVREQIVAQIRQVQARIESMVGRILDRVRQYLDSLERPELDYYGIKRDVSKLFDDPQAGFEALKMRLSTFDRDTLVALVSSHDAVSEADAYRVIDQVESARDTALRKAERLEQQVQSRISELKMQAHQQVEDTRKTAEAASWWLFGTATISAITAAIAGTLAVGG
ncbi:MAG: MFS transporter [Cyanobacteria bacterium P01_A01_bin.114]